MYQPQQWYITQELCKYSREADQGIYQCMQACTHTHTHPHTHTHKHKQTHTQTHTHKHTHTHTHTYTTHHDTRDILYAHKLTCGCVNIIVCNNMHIIMSSNKNYTLVSWLRRLQLHCTKEWPGRREELLLVLDTVYYVYIYTIHTDLGWLVHMVLTLVPRKTRRNVHVNCTLA